MWTTCSLRGPDFTCTFVCNTCHALPQYHYANSPYWSLYILLRTSWENLFKHQDMQFIFGGHFLNSHELYALQRTDIMRRNLMLITIGAVRVTGRCRSCHCCEANLLESCI